MAQREEAGAYFVQSSTLFSIPEQVEQAKQKVNSKLQGRGKTKKGIYIAYFQNFTATYGEPSLLKARYTQALEQEGIEGLALATRPDCLNSEILSVIQNIAKTKFVQIELGLQTSNQDTAQYINRCCTNEDYIDAINKIRAINPNIHIVTHIIFGLPYETEHDMLETVRFVKKCNEQSAFWGVKITVLYVVQGTALANLYEKGKYRALEKEEYFRILKNALNILPKNCVIHRLTGDPAKNTLIAPMWTKDKKKVLNELREPLKTSVFRGNFENAML